MTDVTLAIECEAGVADRLAAALQSATGRDVIQAQRNSLDGSLPTVLQIVQIASSLAATVLPIVAAHVASKKVKKIKIGDVEIENPTPEQLENLWADYLRKRDAHGKETR